MRILAIHVREPMLGPSREKEVVLAGEVATTSRLGVVVLFLLFSRTA